MYRVLSFDSCLYFAYDRRPLTLAAQTNIRKRPRELGEKVRAIQNFVTEMVKADAEPEAVERERISVTFRERDKVDELRKKDLVLENDKQIWKGVLPRLFVTIVGENYNIEEQQFVREMLMAETDAQRRVFLLDWLYATRGIPVPPPATSAQVAPSAPPQPTPPRPSAPGSRERAAYGMSEGP